MSMAEQGAQLWEILAADTENEVGPDRISPSSGFIEFPTIRSKDP